MRVRVIERRARYVRPVMALACVLAGCAAPPVDLEPDRAGGPVPQTPAETAQFLSYTPERDIGRFLASLISEGGRLHVDTVAWQDDLPILLTSVPGESAASDKPVVLVLGLQHGDEQAGKEAALQLIRDAAFGSMHGVLSRFDLLVVPALNPWGGSRRSRYDADSTDLNRDHMRLATVSARALHEIFARTRPVAVLDLHELGPVVYDIQIGVPTHPNVDPRLIEFARFYVLPGVVRDLAEADLTFHEYVSAYPEPAQPSADSLPALAPDAFLTYGPIAANNARNVFALGGAVSFLIEVSSSREIAGLESRTGHLLRTVRSLLTRLTGLADELESRVTHARRQLPETIVLRADNAVDPRRPTLTWRVPSGLGTVMAGTTDRWKPLVRSTLEIGPPRAYLIRPEQRELASLIERHGIPLHELTRPHRVIAGGYPTLPPVAGQAASGHAVAGQAASAERFIRWKEIEFPAGTWLAVSQPRFARLLYTLVEPYSQDGWFSDAATAAPLRDEVYPVYRIMDSTDVESLLRDARERATGRQDLNE